MARRPRRPLGPTGGRTFSETLEMEQFARRLHQVMLEKDMTQSALAAAIWGRTTDKRGYDVAKGRDRISVYLQGKSWPDPKNLKLMCDALGVTPEWLAPDITVSSVDRENPELAMTTVAGHPDKTHLRVNKLVPAAIAAQIIALLATVKNADPTP
jgi:transcriptional regulator with XRE-family HTH domain